MVHYIDSFLFIFIKTIKVIIYNHLLLFYLILNKYLNKLKIFKMENNNILIEPKIEPIYNNEVINKELSQPYELIQYLEEYINFEKNDDIINSIINE